MLLTGNLYRFPLLSALGDPLEWWYGLKPAHRLSLLVDFVAHNVLLPGIIRRRGERASRRFIEFFTASIRNRNTRAAYARAIKQFLDWCKGTAP